MFLVSAARSPLMSSSQRLLRCLQESLTGGGLRRRPLRSVFIGYNAVLAGLFEGATLLGVGVSLLARVA
jgi:hypothetical protein